MRVGSRLPPSVGLTLSSENGKTSILESRNVTVGNKRTSMRLEPQMWDSLERIAQTEGVTLNNLCTQIDLRRGEIGLTSATRVFIISYYRHLLRQHEAERERAGPGLTPRAEGLTGASRARWVLDTVVTDRDLVGAGGHGRTATTRRLG